MSYERMLMSFMIQVSAFIVKLILLPIALLLAFILGKIVRHTSNTVSEIAVNMRTRIHRAYIK